MKEINIDQVGYLTFLILKLMGYMCCDLVKVLRYRQNIIWLMLIFYEAQFLEGK